MAEEDADLRELEISPGAGFRADAELDDNVLPHQSLRLVDALIDADADFDMLVIPGVEHSFHGRHHYVTRRTWDYLVRHLHGTEPPSYRLAPFPPMPDWAVQPSG